MHQQARTPYQDAEVGTGLSEISRMNETTKEVDNLNMGGLGHSIDQLNDFSIHHATF